LFFRKPFAIDAEVSIFPERFSEGRFRGKLITDLQSGKKGLFLCL
jgi:hypothetical protein